MKSLPKRQKKQQYCLRLTDDAAEAIRVMAKALGVSHGHICEHAVLMMYRKHKKQWEKGNNES
jgi:hypothetical protein